jgi:hypothetical protein
MKRMLRSGICRAWPDLTIGNIVYAFSYFRPASINEAVAFLKEHEGAKPLSGG